MKRGLHRGWVWGVALLALALAAATYAQFGGRRSRPIEVDNPRAIFARRGVDFPEWEQSEEMPDDCFTFARLRFNSGRGAYGHPYGRNKWATDYPDSDLNFSYRLQELTALEVDPNGKIVDIDAEQLANYPWVYMIEPGDIYLTDEEAKILREYLLNGGFIMVDDFWGYNEWDTFYEGLKKIFPDREPVELELDHPIFHFVFDLNEKPQVPAIGNAINNRSHGITYEPRSEGGSEEPHYRAIYDDKERMVMIICFNTDLGDGWEREGEDEWYFKEFAERLSFPMGINIVFYAMTH